MTIVRYRHFPAIVTMRAEPQPRRNVYVILAQGGDRDGFHIWHRPGETADLHLLVNWAKTPVPSEQEARVGFSVTLADGGIAVVTASSGCRCGSIGRWAGPSWGHTVMAGVP